jgi:DNA-binding IclR family transcriptional regulator
MSIPGTASGRLFAAYGPQGAVLEALAHEARMAPPAPARPARAKLGGRFGLGAAFDAEVEQVRRQGIACVDGVAVPGVSAVAVPVFDAQGRLVLSLTAIGPSAMFDSSAAGSVVRELRPAATLLSRRLGWKPAAEASTPGRAFK